MCSGSDAAVPVKLFVIRRGVKFMLYYLFCLISAIFISFFAGFLWWKVSSKNKQINYKEFISSKFFVIFAGVLMGMLCSILT